MKNKEDIELNELILQLQEGNENAFSILYDRYSPSLFGLISRILIDSEKAQDVLQDSFVKIWKNAPNYSFEKGTFFTWMLNICRNSAIDELRKVKNDQKSKIQIEADNVYMHNHSDLNIDTLGMKGLVEMLPEEQRIIIDYLYFKGYTQQELADELNLPLGTVKTRARNAVIELKNYFGLILLLWTLKNT